MRINLTLAGGGNRNSGGKSPFSFGTFNRTTPAAAAAPPPPAAIAPAAAPSTSEATDTKASQRRGAENIRNVGGGRGRETAGIARAMKGLLGQ